jgi:hypothetical protein
LPSIGCAGGDKDQPIARYLVYTKGIGLPQQAVWIGDVDGRNMRRLAQGRYGLVSPDGTRIALSRATGVYTTTPEGDDEAFVSRGRAADWFPDSRHLLIFRRNPVRPPSRRSKVHHSESRHLDDAVATWSLGASAAHTGTAERRQETLVRSVFS